MEGVSKGLCMTLVVFFMTGCASRKTQEEIQARRYHLEQDSGFQDIDVSTIPDAVPRAPEGGVKADPYIWNGMSYTPLQTAAGYSEEGVASWYGMKFHGYETANGEIYDMYAMTAAHKTLPLPSYARVTNLENGQSVIVRVNDRGPFHGDRTIDLSWAAAKKLDFHDQGVASVRIEGIDTSPQGLLAFHSSRSADAVETGADSDGLMYLQVAALNSLAGASGLQQRLLGVTEMPVQVVSGDDALFRVRVGPFRSEHELLSLQQVLKDARLTRGFRIYE